MGYTHYWSQDRNLTAKEWQTIAADIRTILTYAQHECGIALADEGGNPGTVPLIDDDIVMFNGLGDASHETFIVRRAIKTAPDYPGEPRSSFASDFCKTERKRYDAVVTACLCYLTTTTRKDRDGEPIIGSEAWDASSDGSGSDFLVGLDLARKALPQYGNVLDIPMGVMKDDRWCAPGVRLVGNAGGCVPNQKFEAHFCVDGKGYVINLKSGESYCFESHIAFAHFLDRTKFAKFKTGGSTGWGSYGKEEPDIWNASGSFDGARHLRIKKAQQKVLSTLFPVDPACAQQPPAYVRPGEMPDNAGRDFCYSIGDLLNLAKGAA